MVSFDFIPAVQYMMYFIYIFHKNDIYIIILYYIEIKKNPEILASNYRTWNRKPLDKTSSPRPQTKTLGPAAEKINTKKLKIYHQDDFLGRKTITQ